MNVYPGMVLRVWSRGKGVYHYGIATYGGYVIDHAPRRGTACRTWDDFSEGETVQIVPWEPGDYPLDEIHQRAVSSIGRNMYSVFKSNCEHFVTWCKRGQAESKQLTKATESAAMGGLAAVVVIGIFSLFFNDDENRS